MASAKYVIDIAAELEGDETLSELDAISADLVTAGKNAEFFQTAIKQVSGDLRVAAQVAGAANDALAAGSEQYRQLERAALMASKAAERAALKNNGVVPDDEAEKARAANAAVEEYAKTLATLDADANAANAEQARLAKTLDNVKKIAGHTDKTIAAQAENYEKFGSALGSVGGPLGTLGQALVRPLQGFSKLSASIGSARAAAVLGVVGFAAVTAAVLALTTAVVAGAVKLATYSVTLADTARNAQLSREAFEAMNPGVAALHDSIDAVNSETMLGVPALNNLAKGLLDAGESSENMARSLRVAALAQKTMGDGAAAEYTRLIQAASDAQKAVDDAAKKSGGAVDKELVAKLDAATTAADTFAARATSKLGGIVARQMQGIGAQSQRLESNLGDIFGTLDIDPVLAGMAKLVGLFDKNSAAGKALSFLFTTVFQPLIDQADTAATAVEAFYLGVMIGAMRLYIALKPTIKAVSEFFGFDDPTLELNFKSITAVGEALAPVLIAIGAVVGTVLLVVFGTLAALIAAQVAIWWLLVKAVQAVISVFELGYDAIVAVYNYLTTTSLSQIATDIMNGFVSVFVNLPATLLGYFTSAGASVLSYLTGIDLSSVGTNIMLGMVRGIGAGVGAVVSAVKNAMASAISAAKSVLGIHSPSKVFGEIGDFTTQGYTEAIDAGTDDAQLATANMLAPPANDNATALRMAQLSGDAGAVSALQRQTSSADAGAPAPVGGAQGGASSASDGGTSTFGAGEYHFHFHGVQGAEDAKEQFEEMLTAAIQGDVAKLGAAKRAA